MLKPSEDTNITMIELRKRDFEVGEQVLWLLSPSDKDKTEAAYEGPYLVLEKVTPVTYRLDTPGKRDKTRLVHANFLKKWNCPSARVLQVMVVSEENTCRR